MTNKRTQILEEASRLINGDRQSDYGPPSENFNRVALGWELILGAEVSAEQVALCMAWLKIARLAGGGNSSDDSYIDGAGYLALAAELSYG
jgi:hypothetical protein